MQLAEVGITREGGREGSETRRDWREHGRMEGRSVAVCVGRRNGAYVPSPPHHWAQGPACPCTDTPAIMLPSSDFHRMEEENWKFQKPDGTGNTGGHKI